MKKSILNLAGAQELSKNEKKSVLGGKQSCVTNSNCPPGYCCKAIGKYCVIANGSQGLCGPEFPG